MNKQLAVKQFMLAAGQNVPTNIIEPDNEVRRLRISLIAEELLELAAASSVSLEIRTIGPNGTVERKRSEDVKWPNGVLEAITDAADAIGDLLVVVYGAAVAWGVNADQVFGEIHRSNMTKFIDGHRRDDGKWIKGPSYSPARIREVLENCDTP